jgi:hypothetical protein
VLERPGRRGLRKLLVSLGLSPPLDIQLLIDRLAERRGRPLRLVAHPIGVHGPFGCWVASSTADYLVYQRETTAAHQRHIILHEIGHIVCGHDLAEVSATPAAHAEEGDGLLENRRFAEDPGVTATSLAAARHRDVYTNTEERQAESIATLLTAWSAVGPQTTPENGALGHVESTFLAAGWR